MLRVQHLSKRYGKAGERAVRDVSFAIPQGGFFSLLGPSGCGKTTTLRCVAGLERPDSGKIMLNDEVIYSSQKHIDRAPQRRAIGMVFQSYAIWPHMTVGANIRYPLEVARTAKGEAADRERAMLARMGLDDYQERWATQLSGGQQQRLALGRALIASPALLLLDEPLSNLDAKLRISMRGELRRMQRDLGVTTLYVTHDQAEALSLSDIVAVIRSGVIEQVGTPRQIYDEPATEFVADFVGQANLIKGRPTGDGAVDTPLGLLVCDRHVEGAEATVCVRPENVRVLAGDDPGTGPNVFEGRAREVEFIGNALICTIVRNDVTIRTFSPPSTEVRVGEPVRFQIPSDGAHPIVARTLDAALEQELAAPDAATDVDHEMKGQ